MNRDTRETLIIAGVSLALTLAFLAFMALVNASSAKPGLPEPCNIQKCPAVGDSP